MQYDVNPADVPMQEIVEVEPVEYESNDDEGDNEPEDPEDGDQQEGREDQEEADEEEGPVMVQPLMHGREQEEDEEPFFGIFGFDDGNVIDLLIPTILNLHQNQFAFASIFYIIYIIFTPLHIRMKGNRKYFWETSLKLKKLKDFGINSSIIMGTLSEK